MSLGAKPLNTENQLVQKFSVFLRNSGYRVRLEVPTMGQIADLVATKGRWLSVFEAKLDNWKRAVEQCRCHEAVADFICILLPRDPQTEDLKILAKAKGYGVVYFDALSDTFVWRYNPQKNTRVWRPQRRQLARTLRKIKNDN